MTINKLAIIGGSGLYDIEEFSDRQLIDLKTPWGKPSDQILKTNYFRNPLAAPTRRFEANVKLFPETFSKTGYSHLKNDLREWFY